MNGNIQSLADLMQYYNKVNDLKRRIDNSLIINNNIICKNESNIKYINNSMTTINNQIYKPSIWKVNVPIDSNKCFFHKFMAS